MMSTSVIRRDINANHNNTKLPTVCRSNTPFGCMEQYDLIVYTQSDIAMATEMDECLSDLKTDLYRNRVLDDYNAFRASRRVSQFANHFNSFKGKKIYTAPGIRDFTRGCACEAENPPMQLKSGCKDCCMEIVEDMHHCKCVEFSGGTDTFAKNGCMHAGDWDTELVSHSYYFYDLCLICRKFDCFSMECEHKSLHADVSILNQRNFANIADPSGMYSHRLSVYRRQDEELKKAQDCAANAGKERMAVPIPVANVRELKMREYLATAWSYVR